MTTSKNTTEIDAVTTPPAGLELPPDALVAAAAERLVDEVKAPVSL